MACQFIRADDSCLLSYVINSPITFANPRLWLVSVFVSVPVAVPVKVDTADKGFAKEELRSRHTVLTQLLSKLINLYDDLSRPGWLANNEHHHAASRPPLPPPPPPPASPPPRLPSSPVRRIHQLFGVLANVGQRALPVCASGPISSARASLWDTATVSCHCARL